MRTAENAQQVPVLSVPVCVMSIGEAQFCRYLNHIAYFDYHHQAPVREHLYKQKPGIAAGLSHFVRAISVP